MALGCMRVSLHSYSPAVEISRGKAGVYSIEGIPAGSRVLSVCVGPHNGGRPGALGYVRPQCTDQPELQQ